MYVGRDFHPADTGEDEIYTFDFRRDFDEGETIVSSEWTCAIASDSESIDDDAPNTHHSDDSETLDTDTTSRRRISGLVAGVKYVLEATVTTSLGNMRTLWSHVTCIEPH